MGVGRAYIDFENLVKAFMEDNFLDVEVWRGIPSDAEILNGGYDMEKRAWYVDFEHPDYEDFEKLEIRLIKYFARTEGNDEIPFE